jgi:hypothetical protein
LGVAFPQLDMPHIVRGNRCLISKYRNHISDACWAWSYDRFNPERPSELTYQLRLSAQIIGCCVQKAEAYAGADFAKI